MQMYEGQSQSASVSQSQRLTLDKLRAKIPADFTQAQKDLYMRLDARNLQNWLMKDAIFEGNFKTGLSLIDGPESAKDGLVFILKYSPLNSKRGLHNKGVMSFWGLMRNMGLVWDKSQKVFQYAEQFRAQ